MKSNKDMCATKGHGSFPLRIDAKPRKHGDRSVFDTLVVHAVNDGCWTGNSLGSSLRKTPRLGKSRKAGNLKRLAGACINGGVCGLIRQYTGNLTSRSYSGSSAFYVPIDNPPVRRCCMAVVSSCRGVWHWVAKRTQSAKLRGSKYSRSISRQLDTNKLIVNVKHQRKFEAQRHSRRQKSSQYGLYRLGYTRATRAATKGC